MEQQNNFLIPVAVIIAGALIAWGLMSDKPTAPVDSANPQGAEVTLAPVTADDHILGDPNAEAIIISYSDLECPFCKSFHLTTKKIIDEYGKDGRVALVFRQFPIDQLHSKARVEAIATECAAELGGNAKFWEYLNIIFDRTPSGNGFDLAELPEIAEEIGLDKDKFTACLDNEEMANRVTDQQATGVAAGVRGTPQSYIVTKDGKETSIDGGQSYDTVKLMLDTVLEN